MNFKRKISWIEILIFASIAALVWLKYTTNQVEKEKLYQDTVIKNEYQE